jgi:hypothetical protein
VGDGGHLRAGMGVGAAAQRSSARGASKANRGAPRGRGARRRGQWGGGGRRWRGRVPVWSIGGGAMGAEEGTKVAPAGSSGIGLEEMAWVFFEVVR